jgi:ornithine cyclodeaminase/alanine dehydrogenase-like protein (mu-crystallin family)
MREIIEKINEAFALYGKGEIESPLRTRISVSNAGNILFMPSLIKSSSNIASIKVVSVYPDIGQERPSLSATVLLIDGNDGSVKAIIDGVTLTAIRTGAVSGLSCRYLARTDAEVLGIIGAGGQAPYQISGIASELRLKEVRIFSRHIERSEALADRCRTELKIAAKTCKSVEECVTESDVVVTATTSKTPVFGGKLVRPGTHIIAIGAYMPDSREIDSDLVSRASIYVDSLEATLEEAGDILIPMREGSLMKNAIKGDLADLVLGRVAGRASGREITLFKSVGLAFEDTGIGWLLYEKALASNTGNWVDI